MIYNVKSAHKLNLNMVGTVIVIKLALYLKLKDAGQSVNLKTTILLWFKFSITK